MKEKALLGTALIFLGGCHSNSLRHNHRSARTHVQIIMLCQQLALTETKDYASLAALTPCMRQFQDYALTEVHTDWAQTAAYRYHIARSPRPSDLLVHRETAGIPDQWTIYVFRRSIPRSPCIERCRTQ